MARRDGAPSAAQGRVFDGYLTIRDSCAQCGLDLRQHSPVAGPAFLTVAVLGFVTGPLLWLAARALTPDPVVLALVGIVIMPVLAVLLLRVFKGAMVGYLWALDIRKPRRAGED